MNVLHILDHFSPINTGYTFRSKYIIQIQKKLGIDPFIMVSPKSNFGFKEYEVIDGIECVRCSIKKGSWFSKVPFLKEIEVMRILERKITEEVKKRKIDLLHAHSPLLCGWPAYRVGKKLKVPVVYEVRALWEDAAVDQNKTKKKSLRYFLSRWFETQLFKRVDAICTICTGLKIDIEKRGIDGSKIHIIPNGVDVERFIPHDKDMKLLKELNLENKFLIGFIGSFFKFEGLTKLIKALPFLIEHSNNVRLLLVGKGEDEENLKSLVAQMRLNDKVVFTGQVPHNQILSYYSIIDILVYPRESSKLTEGVTPLKPLEAMAMKKAIIGSDVGGIKELVTDQETGLLFKNDSVDDLVKKVCELIDDSKKSIRLGQTARQFVLGEKNWETIINRDIELYKVLLKKR
ncbi:MAG: glycosyltransferase, exosortase A system-associated [Prolixibacteraceae bacterium]|nr:glycosyltransferase, exosortase A system-associated [Prolixibacteraceae bacterium]